MSEEFVKSFIEFANKIPYVKKGEIVSLTFSIIYEKEKPGKRNVLVTSYEIPEALIEIIVQSPKEIVFEGVDQKKLRSMKISGKKFYTNYKPNLDNFITVEGNFYTIAGNEILTVVSHKKNFLKLIEPEKKMKFQKDLLMYAKKLLKDVDGFSLCMVNWVKEDMWDVSRMVFFNAENHTEILVDVFKGEKETMKFLWKEIEDKKKLRGSLYSGKCNDEKVLCSIFDDKRFMIAKCTKEKKDLLTEIVPKIMGMIK